MIHSVMDVLNIYKKGHLWVGLIEKSEEEYLGYFEQHYDIEEENVYSKFCEDINLDLTYGYDEDFIIIYRLLPQPIPISKMLSEVPLLNSEEKSKVLLRCEDLGIEKLNTFVFYSEPDLNVDKDRTYNGLYYLGEFLAETI